MQPGLVTLPSIVYVLPAPVAPAREDPRISSGSIVVLVVVVVVVVVVVIIIIME